MSHVPAAHAAYRAGITRATLHRWVREGKLARYEDGYDMAEVFKVSDERDLEAMLRRLGKCAKDRAEIHEHVRNVGARRLTIAG